MKELAFASIKTLSEKLKKKEISAKELIDYTIGRFDRLNPILKSALEVFDAQTLYDTLEHSEEKLSDNNRLWGIPGLIKDNICQKDRITSCASKILENFKAPYDATVNYKLKRVGAISVGRANCDEFAMGSSTETSAYAKTKNPWDIMRVPGGSSGGSAAAVAAGLVPWALGSETGGSVRQPAALCGIVGLKPTYGRVSRYGLVAYASSLDQVGTLTRTVYDNALLFSCIAGKDVNDSTTLDVEATDYTRNLTGKIKQGLKIGVVENALNASGFDPEVTKALHQVLKEYEKLGAQLVPLKLPLMDSAAAIYFVLSRAEAASNLSRFDGVRYGLRVPADNLNKMYTQTRSAGFGRVVKQRIMVGNYVLSAGHADQYYNSAKKVQALLRAQFLQAFGSVDLLFAPVSPTPAFEFDAFLQNSLALDLQDYFTASANLTGMPALAAPCGFTSSGLPVGYQLMGPDLSEELLFQTAYAYEQVNSWHKKVPAQFA